MYMKTQTYMQPPPIVWILSFDHYVQFIYFWLNIFNQIIGPSI